MNNTNPSRLMPYRYQRANDALAAYGSSAGLDLRERMTDLLTDLRHLADKEGVPFAKALEWSFKHHRDEVMLEQALSKYP